MSKYDAYLFDMDGTVLDTIEDLKNSVNYMLGQIGMEKRNTEEIKTFLGNGPVHLLRCSLRGEVKDEEFEKCFKIYKEHYAKHCMDETRPYDGIMDVLKEIKKQGAKIAVVSNKHQSAVVQLNEKYFCGIFDEVSGDREGVKRKPAPDSVDIVLNSLGVSREKALFIGDSEVDFETAKNAGMDFVAVAWGFRTEEQLKLSGVKNFVYTPEELLKYI